MNSKENLKKQIFNKKLKSRQPKGGPAKNTQDLETTTRRLKSYQYHFNNFKRYMIFKNYRGVAKKMSKPRSFQYFKVQNLKGRCRLYF